MHKLLGLTLDFFVCIKNLINIQPNDSNIESSKTSWTLPQYMEGKSVSGPRQRLTPAVRFYQFCLEPSPQIKITQANKFNSFNRMLM